MLQYNIPQPFKLRLLKQISKAVLCKMRPFFDATEFPSFRFSNESSSYRMLRLNCTLSNLSPVASPVSTTTPTIGSIPHIQRNDSAVTTPVLETTKPIDDKVMKAEVSAV